MRDGVARAVLVGMVAIVGAGWTVPVAANHSWNGYHWSRHGPARVVDLGNNVSGDWADFLGPVSDDWSSNAAAASFIKTQVVSGQSNPGRCPATAGRVEVCNADYGSTSWLGLATVWTHGKHIYQGTVKLNDRYVASLLDDNPGLPVSDVSSRERHALCQEVGHTLGLGHATGVTCMDDKNGLDNPLYVGPNAHDYDQLVTVYTHRDKRKKARANVASAGSARESVPPDPADLVAAGLTRPGDFDAIVEELGGGRQRISWVLWAE